MEGRLAPNTFLDKEFFHFIFTRELTLSTALFINMSDIEDQQEREEIIAIQKREESLKKLMQETGCEIVQENGQRKIGGPPPSKYS